MITTEVEDWRDEIIYQIFVDRFANGDLNNDFNVDENAPGSYHGGSLAPVLDGVTGLPVTRTGVWTADAGSLPPWKGDYHNDLNTQMTYIAYQAAGHFDEALKLKPDLVPALMGRGDLATDALLECLTATAAQG